MDQVELMIILGEAWERWRGYNRRQHCIESGGFMRRQGNKTVCSGQYVDCCQIVVSNNCGHLDIFQSWSHWPHYEYTGFIAGQEPWPE